MRSPRETKRGSTSRKSETRLLFSARLKIGGQVFGPPSRRKAFGNRPRSRLRGDNATALRQAAHHPPARRAQSERQSTKEAYLRAIASLYALDVSLARRCTDRLPHACHRAVADGHAVTIRRAHERRCARAACRGTRGRTTARPMPSHCRWGRPAPPITCPRRPTRGCAAAPSRTRAQLEPEMGRLHGKAKCSRTGGASTGVVSVKLRPSMAITILISSNARWRPGPTPRSAAKGHESLGGVARVGLLDAVNQRSG